MHDSSFPPHRTYSSSRTSTPEALALLSKYLEESDTNSHLHPNAVLTETGPVVPFSGETTGLVLHNLKRLQAGLRGEHLAADIDPSKVAEGVTILAGEADVAAGRDANADGEMQFDWQDLSEFEQEQEDVEGDIGSRTTGMGIVDGDEQRKVLEVRNTSEDKTKRKREKKARLKEQKRQKEEERIVNGAVH